MSYVAKQWSDTDITSTDLNNIELGITNAHNNIEILNEDVASLMYNQNKLTEEVDKLADQNSNIATELTSLLSSDLLSSLQSLNISSYLTKAAQTFTVAELNQIYSNLNLKTYVSSLIDEIEIPEVTIDTALNIKSTNAVTNSAITKAIQELQETVGSLGSLDGTLKLSDLEDDSSHRLVTDVLIAKWNSAVYTETDPTVPDWAKASSKPEYYYTEIINTPKIDDSLDASSSNAVQNKVIVTELNDLYDNLTDDYKDYTDSAITSLINGATSSNSTLKGLEDSISTVSNSLSSLSSSVSSQFDTLNSTTYTGTTENNFVHKTGTETISGEKTFTKTTQFTNASSPHISGNGTSLYLSNNSSWNEGTFVFEASSFRPDSSRSGEISLGATTEKWKNLYLSGDANITGAANITGTADIKGNTYVTNLYVTGDIRQEGSAYQTHAEEVYTTNDFINLRDGQTDKTGALTGYSGLRVLNYDGASTNMMLVVDNTGVARVGDEGDEQPLATREEEPQDKAFTYWDDSTNMLITDSAITHSDAGTIKATAFIGSLTGNVTGNVTGNLTGDVTGNSSTSTKIWETHSANNDSYPLLFSGDAVSNTSNRYSETNFSSLIYCNPSAGSVILGGTLTLNTGVITFDSSSSTFII